MLDRSVRLAILDDYEIVVAGLVSVLQPYADRVEIVSAGVCETPPADVDVILYDTFGSAGAGGCENAPAIRSRRGQRIAVFTAIAEADAVARALGEDIDGYLHKSLSAEELVDALERIYGGERVVLVPDATDTSPVLDGLTWPGQAEGLSEREAEVIALICQGLSNDEVARRAYLSINTIKSYIRSAYRKMGVRSRSQAVLWGVGRGMDTYRGADSTRQGDEV